MRRTTPWASEPLSSGSITPCTTFQAAYPKSPTDRRTSKRPPRGCVPMLCIAPSGLAVLPPIPSASSTARRPAARQPTPPAPGGLRPAARQRAVGTRGLAAHPECLQHRQEPDGRVDHALRHVAEPRHDPHPRSRVPGRRLGVPLGVFDRPIRASHPPTLLRFQPAILYTQG